MSNNPTAGQPSVATEAATHQRGSTGHDAALARIGDALSGLRYGSVLAIVQDGVIVQIERTEKTRLGKSDR